MDTKILLEKIEDLAKKTIPILIEKGLTISTAESCTGGMLSETITSVSGASSIFEIGISAYTNRIKHEALSVPMSVLQNDGAISLKTAMYMAKNILTLSGSKIGVGITGNAGPTTSENKPVGLVYIAIADEDTYFVKKIQYPKTANRESIRLCAVLNALELIAKYVNSSTTLLGQMVPHGEELFIDENSSNGYDLGLSELKLEPLKAIPLKHLSSSEFLSEDEEDEDTPNILAKISLATKMFFINLVNFFKKIQFKKHFVNLIKKLKPKKKLDPKVLIKAGIFALCILSFIISSTAIASHFIKERKERKIVASARDEWNYAEEKNEISGTLNSFNDLRIQNSDVMGWITINGTNIDNPVYLTNNNDFYISHNMLKEKSNHGALFFDCNNEITQYASSQNLTIYGHNMKDGSMFASLLNYRKLDFYKENPTFSLTTLYGKNEYRVFAVMVMNASAADDNGYIYNFITSDFPDQTAFIKWADEAKERSIINTSVEISENDEILTLVTCSEDFKNSRFVVMARKTRADETAPVDTESAKLNTNPRYPQAWYDKNGFDGYKPNK